MEIPVDSPLGFIGLALLALGGFLILAGFNIISVHWRTISFQIPNETLWRETQD